MFIDHQGRAVTSAGDLTAATACEFSWLRQLDERLGRLESVERTVDAMLDRAAALGDVHEARILDRYWQDASNQNGRVVEIARPNVRDPQETQAAVQATLDAFRSGADVVFQATFAAEDDHGRPFVGFADFIVRSPDGSYRVQDTKLARSAKVTALLQLAAYAGQLRAHHIPVDPEVDLILGDGTVSTHRLKAIEPMYVLRRQRLARIVAERLADSNPVDWEDERHPKCGACDHCAAEIEATRDLWQVYNLRGSLRTKLRAAGLRSIGDVAAWQPGQDTGASRARPCSGWPGRPGCRSPARVWSSRSTRWWTPGCSPHFRSRAPGASSSTSRATRCGPLTAPPGDWTTCSGWWTPKARDG